MHLISGILFLFQVNEHNDSQDVSHEITQEMGIFTMSGNRYQAPSLPQGTFWEKILRSDVVSCTSLSGWLLPYWVQWYVGGSGRWPKHPLTNLEAFSCTRRENVQILFET